MQPASSEEDSTNPSGRINPISPTNLGMVRASQLVVGDRRVLTEATSEPDIRTLPCVTRNSVTALTGVRYYDRQIGHPITVVVNGQGESSEHEKSGRKENKQSRAMEKQVTAEQQNALDS